MNDEFDELLAEYMKDPVFARRYRRRCTLYTGRLCIDGHKYRRRQLARRKRRR